MALPSCCEEAAHHEHQPPSTVKMDAALTGPEAFGSPLRRYWTHIWQEVGGGYLLGGLVASMAMAISGSAVLVGYDGGVVRWWFGVDVPPRVGDIGNYLVCYAGMFGLSATWYGMLRRIRRSPSLRCRDLAVVGALWAFPLLVGPPLFSRDVYSYLAQGMLAHLQLSPYSYSPAVLGVSRFGNLLAAVSPVWRLTTAPYGPVFVSMAAWLAGVSGDHVAGGTLLLRLPELAGIGLAAAALPGIARRMGAEPREALWLGAASPLVLFELLSAGHNDALMVGLVMVGLLFALDRRPLLAVGVCSLATLVKLPALLAVVFIAWTWARERPGVRAKLRALATAASLSVVVLVIGSALTAGYGWVSSQLVTVPDKVSVPVSPSKAFASAVHLASKVLGLGWSGQFITGLVRDAGMLIAAAALLAILGKARLPTLVPSLGIAMVLGVLLGSDVWPWYLTWGLVPLAAWRPAQRSWLLLAAVGLFDLVITPAGQLVVPDAAAPAVAVAWLVLGIAAWKTRAGSGGLRALQGTMRSSPGRAPVPVGSGAQADD